MPDLTKFQVGNLPLSLGGKHFIAPPPSAARGVMLTRVVTMGLTSSLSQTDLTEDSILQLLGPEVVETLNEDKDWGLDRLSLGNECFQEMLDAELPQADIHMAARYAAYYWVFGKQTADKCLENELMERNGEAMPSPTDVELPKQ